MKVGNILSIAIVSVLLAACGGGGNSIRGNPSINEVPEQFREAVSRAKTFELDDDDGTEFSKITLAGKAGGKYNFSDLPNGPSNLSISVTYGDAQSTTTYSGTMLVYQQPYSVVTGTTWTKGSGAEFEPDDLDVFYTADILGFRTPTSSFSDLIAQNAIFDYKGVAFDGQEEATLNYRVLFGTRQGHGSIAGFTRTGMITLWPQQIDNDWIIRGEAHMEKAPRGESDINYELVFFGPNAEEIAGEVYDPRGDGLIGDSGIIFAGKR